MTEKKTKRPKETGMGVELSLPSTFCGILSLHPLANFVRMVAV